MLDFPPSTRRMRIHGHSDGTIGEPSSGESEIDVCAPDQAVSSKLYAVEKRSRDLPPERRYRLRQEQARPLLDAFHAWLVKTHPRVAPQSLLGEALGYALNQWPTLITYLEAVADLHRWYHELDATELDAIALDRFSVFISTRCQPSSRIVAWSGCHTLPRT